MARVQPDPTSQKTYCFYLSCAVPMASLQPDPRALQPDPRVFSLETGVSVSVRGRFWHVCFCLLLSSVVVVLRVTLVLFLLAVRCCKLAFVLACT